MFRKLSLTKNIFKFAAFILIALAILIGLYTRIFTYDDFVSFGLDQIRDAEIYAHMKEGKWPAVGPVAPIKDDIEFFLFPLYHYLVGIFTLGSNNLNLQLLINGIFSFLSIPLFVLLIYRLLENVKKEKRVFLASIGGLWLSIFANDIVNSNLAWNPSPIPFFIILFFVILDQINRVHEHITLVEHYLLWISLGIVTAFLSSLHTWTMLTFIPILIFNCVYFVVIYLKKNNGRKIIYPFIGIVYVLMFLSTYIISEITTNWQNSQSMLTAFTRSATGITTAWDVLLARPFTNFLNLIEKAYIIEPQYYLVGLPLIAAIVVFCFVYFKGNKFLFAQITLSIVVYSFGILNYSGEVKTRYQIIMWLYPMILTICTLAYTSPNIFLKTFQLLIASSFVIISFYFNWIYSINFMSRVTGEKKLIDTDEMVNILSTLPDNSKICYPRGAEFDYYEQFKFIEKYIVNKNHKLQNNCNSGDYYVYLKNLPRIRTDYTTYRNTKKVPSEYEPVLEGTSFIVYKTN